MCRTMLVPLSGKVPKMSGETVDRDAIFDAMVVQTEPFALCELAPKGLLSMPGTKTATLHYVLSGSGLLSLSGQAPVALRTGSLALVPASRHHVLAGETGGQMRLAQCQPAAVGLEQAREGGDAPGCLVLCGRVSLGLAGAGAIIDLIQTAIVDERAASPVRDRAFDLLLGELTAPRLGSRAMIRTLLLACLLDLMRERLAMADPAVSWMTALVDQSLWPALKAMLDAPGAPHTLEGLAERAAMSRSRFADRFRAAYGKPPMVLLHDLRMSHAARLLLETRLPVARVAEIAGFASRGHFTERFAARYGQSPGQFRQVADRTVPVTPARAEAPASP